MIKEKKINFIKIKENLNIKNHFYLFLYFFYSLILKEFFLPIFKQDLIEKFIYS